MRINTEQCPTEVLEQLMQWYEACRIEMLRAVDIFSVFMFISCFKRWNSVYVNILQVFMLTRKTDYWLRTVYMVHSKLDYFYLWRCTADLKLLKSTHNVTWDTQTTNSANKPFLGYFGTSWIHLHQVIQFPFVINLNLSQTVLDFLLTFVSLLYFACFISTEFQSFTIGRLLQGVFQPNKIHLICIVCLIFNILTSAN